MLHRMGRNNDQVILTSALLQMQLSRVRAVGARESENSIDGVLQLRALCYTGRKVKCWRPRVKALI